MAVISRPATPIPMHDPILRRFRATIERLYGSRIDRIVLFGSRARGEAAADSDYDIAVFLRDITDRWEEFDRLADVRTEFLNSTGVFIEAIPFETNAYRDSISLMREIRREGVDI